MHGDTGLLSAPGDIAGLADNIVTLLRNPEQRASMGRAGRRRGEEVFNPQQMAYTMEQTYRAVLDSPRPCADPPAILTLRNGSTAPCGRGLGMDARCLA